ncbi:hypothetical protein J5N97_020762 [Dioscorea zingiberensis]|uniref:Receptor-like serine/threonine-protein kinase n=1 Tax=Dioscorea zingiberensis TaxID=325984 RepID=A0A9D5CHV2_9LILI|nr:hypothetical protein J5N97_020762 [Dioscorea zingiberensis]
MLSLSRPHFKLLMMFLFNNVLLQVLLISPLLSVSAQTTYRNISLGTTLTTSGTTTSWLSPSADFAFGFLPLPTNASLFLLAIWFAKTGNNTIVWHANGDSPVPDGSKLQLQTNGILILTDNHGVSIWNTSPSGSASYAALLDTGNLILATRDSSINWQSFDYPKDTLLPTQTLQMNNQLRSQLYDHDFSGGRFVLRMQGDGNLVMYPLALPTESTYQAYWASSTVGLGNQLIFNRSGEMYLEFTNKTLVNITTSKLSMTDFYQRVKLDPDGVLRHYVYPKDKTRRSSSWSDGWTVVDYMPSDICGSFLAYIGAGACGFNSYCVVNQDGRRSCECPPQYSFLNPEDPFQGCKPDFLLPSCSPAATGEQQQGGFVLIEMAKTDWPFCDYENYPSFSEDQCRDNCLKDCFCSAAIFSSLGCFKKRFPLSNGRSGSDSYGKTLIKVASTTINTTSISQGGSPNLHDDKKKDDRKAWIIAGASSLAVSLIILSGSIVTLARNNRGKRLLHQGSGRISESNNNLKRFTYKQLDEATNGFAKELGRGAFGIVYEGVLQSRTVAVKRLINGNSPEIEKEFVAELQSIGQTHHKNLVCLFGYCNDGVNHLLVYEFMSNGSLTGFLFGGVRKPAWNKRVDIAIGIARGLLKNVESHEMGCEDEGVLVYWAYDCYRDGKVESLIRDDEEAMADFELVLRLLMLGIWCVQEDPSRRPTIRRVNQVLDGAVVVPAPPDPSNEYSKSK